MKTSNVSGKSSSKYCRVTDSLCFARWVINGDFCLGPLFPVRLSGMDHLWPVKSVDIQSQNIFDKLELLDSKITSTRKIDDSDSRIVSNSPRSIIPRHS